MSNMKRLWEELPEEERDRLMREGGLTEASLKRIDEWLKKQQAPKLEEELND